MYKKLLISVVALIIGIFSFTISFANNGMQEAADGVRNVVGGAENAIEDAAKGISNASKDATSKMEQGANNVGNAVKNTTNDAMNNDRRTDNNNNYTATRTSATTDNTFMGMNATAWTWLILGIAAIAIVALVWYYSMQLRSNDYDTRD